MFVYFYPLYQTPACTAHPFLYYKAITNQRTDFALKVQCQEKSMEFYHMSCSFRPKQWPRTGFTFLRSSVKELRFFSKWCPFYKHPLNWLARTFFDSHAILECDTERAHEAVYVTLRISNLWNATDSMSGMPLHRCTAVWA